MLQPINALLATTNATAASVYFSGTFAPIFAGIAGTFGQSVRAMLERFLTISCAGIYIISSILYLDPWHILHSMLSYLLIAPAFTNILVRLAPRISVSRSLTFSFRRMFMVRLLFASLPIATDVLSCSSQLSVI